MQRASLLSRPPATLLSAVEAPLAGSRLHTVLLCDCSEGDSPARSRHREFCLPWSPWAAAPARAHLEVLLPWRSPAATWVWCLFSRLVSSVRAELLVVPQYRG